MIELSYMTESLVKTFTAEPGRMVTVLGYACGFTLLVAMVSDSIIRLRRPASQKNMVRKIGRKESEE